jgi:hypothetical protein
LSRIDVRLAVRRLVALGELEHFDGSR